jgi:hypothetical protein
VCQAQQTAGVLQGPWQVLDLCNTKKVTFETIHYNYKHLQLNTMFLTPPTMLSSPCELVSLPDGSATNSGFDDFILDE